MSEDKLLRDDLVELRGAFLQFREIVIDEMARLRIEIDAVHRASLEACGKSLDEKRLEHFRLHLKPQRSSLVDELRKKFGLSQKR